MKTFIITAYTLAVAGILACPGVIIAAALEEPIELGFVQVPFGIGSRVGPGIPPGLEFQYALLSTFMGRPVGCSGQDATIFDGILVPPATSTQTFDVFQEDDPVSFDIIATALINGCSDFFSISIGFAGFAPTGSISGSPLEIPVPPHAEIHFIRMTVPPFDIAQDPDDPPFIVALPISGTSVRFSAYGFPPLMDSMPPAIIISKNPATLWPPNGKLVPVMVSGTITDETDGSGVKNATFTVRDEYGQIQPSGSVPLEADGRYTFTVALEASRRGNDQDGRHYTIVVSAKDIAGNLGVASTIVTVPHDQDN
jgi:hypothetical protein